MQIKYQVWRRGDSFRFYFLASSALLKAEERRFMIEIVLK